MSKKSKDKGDPLDNYNPQVWPADPAAQRRTWEDAMTTQMQLHSRLAVLQQENIRLRGTNDEVIDDTKRKIKDKDERIDQYTKTIGQHEADLETLKKEKTEIEELVKNSLEEAAKQQDDLREEIKKQAIQFTQKIKELNDKNANLLEYENSKEVFEQHMKDLKRDLEKEKKEKQFELGEKEREKIQATEKLRKEMLYKIKETKANLLALNDEQLQTTTRLTILQNHQLTTELEYQSKQTEQLLIRNNKMQIKIETLNRDIQIHKEVEKELAKRSHFCQKVIKRLKLQIKDLESNKVSGGGDTGRNMVLSAGDARRNTKHGHSKSFQNSNDLAVNKQNEDLINFLEHKLEEIEKKLQKTQIEYESLQQDYVEIQDKMNISREKYKRAALLMTEFLDDLLNQTPNILESDKDMHLNLEKIKETPFEQLQKEDKVALVLVLLKQLQPYLSANNLSTAPMHVQQPRGSNQQTMGSMQNSQQQYYNDKADEVLRKHGGQGNSGDVDALQSILNNINVQHQKQGENQRLPPI